MRKSIKLGRAKYCTELKIDRPLSILFRRGTNKAESPENGDNIWVRRAREKHFFFEKKVFFMDRQRCAVKVLVRITCSN
jgi:hypothetical protein